MSTVSRPATAFQRPKQRRPRKEAGSHLKYLRGLPCLTCGFLGGSDAAHIRSAAPELGKRETGKAEKPSDIWAVPLCRNCHTVQHSIIEMSFWNAHNIDPFLIALALWACTGDEETGQTIIHRHRDNSTKS